MHSFDEQPLRKFYSAKTERNPNDYLEHRLKVWAYWYVKLLANGLDYNSRSVEGGLMDDGGLLSRGTAARDIPTHPEAEEMDGFINELGRYDSSCAKAIKIRYTSNKSIKEISAEWNEKRPREFYEKVKAAKMWLIGRVSRG